MVLILKSLSVLLNAIPLRAALAVGRAGGTLVRVCVRYRRGELMETLRRCLPEKSDAELRRLSADLYRHFGMTIVEFLRTIGRPPSNVRDWVTVEGAEHWSAAHAQGKGCLVLGGHIGNWELAGVSGAMLGYGAHAVVKHLRNPKVDAFIQDSRRRLGLNILSRRNSYRQCLRLLRKGETVTMILDQNMIREEGVFVDFFGKAANTTPGLAVLAAQTGAPVLPAYMIRNADYTHTIRFMPPLPPPQSKSREAIQEATQVYTQVLETIIREHPDQWIWFHRRWKTRPLEEEAGAR